MKCKKCGSYAINHHLHGRDGTDRDLCDVCYWKKRFFKLKDKINHDYALKSSIKANTL